MVLALVSLAVVAHHSELSMGSMGDMHRGHGLPAMQMCLGTVAAVGAAVAAVAVVVALLAIGAWWPRVLSAPVVLGVPLAAPGGGARAGPAHRSILCVWRH